MARRIKRTLRRKKKRRNDGGPRKRSRHLQGIVDIDPGNYELLRKFMTDHGKIMPIRLTGATARQQRQIRRAIRRARVMGILP